MTWFKVDDKLGEHPKVRAIPRGRRRNAMGLWVLAGAWCALNTKQDGNVPAFMIEELCADEADALELARVGLWHAAGHECDCTQPRDVDGYVFHHWADLQPTYAEVTAKREAEAERQRKHRERKRAERDADTTSNGHAPVTRDSTVSHGPVHVSRPDPTRPDPYLSQVGGLRTETLHASDATMRPEDARCSKHKGIIEDPGPCRGCMRAREAASESAERAKAERRAARENCRRCGGSGFIENADGDPVGKCDHRPILEVVGE